MGFTREQVQQLGSIELLVIAGTLPRQSTIIIRFLLADRPSTYNSIIGKAALNKFGVVTSTPHLKMKFLTDHGVGK